MPRSWPNTDPTADRAQIEIVELDREPEARPPTQPAASGGHQGLILLAGAMVMLAAVALLPAAEPEVAQPVAETLPRPAEATTVPTRPEMLVGVVTDESFPISLVSGLDGYASLAGPVEMNGRHWVIGTPPPPALKAVVLSSADGGAWAVETELVAPPGGALRVDEMALSNAGLVAAGTVGARAGSPYWLTLPGDLTVWRSTDGRDWRAEALGAPIANTQFWVNQVVTSGSTLLVNGWRETTTNPAAVLGAIPAELEPALTRGDLWLWPGYGRLEIAAPPGLVIFSTSTSLWDQTGKGFLFRSGVGERWEVTEPFDGFAGTIAVLPEGGFVTIGPGSFTSAFGVVWQLNSRVPPAHYYVNWGDRVAGQRLSGTSYLIGDGAGFVTVSFPSEIDGRSGYVALDGGPAGLAATVATHTKYRSMSVGAGGYTLTSDLTLTGPDLSEPIQIFPYAPHRYNPATDMVTVVAGDQTFEFSLADLQGLSAYPPPRYDLYVSTDGVNWSSGQIGLFSNDLRLVGGGADFFLFGSVGTGRGPGEPMTVYRAGPFD
ncbi:MAG: hypothetical protein ACT4OP_09905 [Actinomycetota bacterium]